MNNRNRNTFDVVEKFRKFRSIFDKIFITIFGSLWIFATLWDIYKLQRYWLDFAIEFYTSFFIFYMMIYSINPKSLPKKIYNSFRLMTTIKGRGTLLLIISSLFLSDKHSFHQFCAICLFVGGIFYFICEILVPTTQDELDKIDIIYNPITKNDNKNNGTTEVKISNISINTQISTASNKTNVEKNEGNNNNDTTINNNLINISQTIFIDGNNGKNLNTNIENQQDNSENNIINNDENKNKNDNPPVCENEIVRKTDNPYEIPEDF